MISTPSAGADQLICAPSTLLHVTRDYPPASKGGISTAVAGAARAAAAVGHRVWVLSFDAWRPRARAGGMPLAPATQEHGVTVQRVRAPHHVAQLLPVIAALAPDLVLVHHGMLWRAAKTLAPDVPSLLFAHVIHAEMNRLRAVSETLSSAAQVEALREAEWVATPSAEAANVLRGHHPAVGAALRVLPLGLSPPGLSPPGLSPPGLSPLGTRICRPIAAEPADDAVAARARTVVAVGRYDRAKGTADLVEAVALLRDLAPDVQVRVVGGVPDNPRAERRWRARLIAAGGDSLTCVGWVSATALQRELCGAAVGLFPSHMETFGLALLEAMAAGVAVVATDVPGHRALLGTATGGPLRGVLVPPMAPAALAQATAKLLVEPARADRLATTARAFAATQTWPLVWPAWQRLIDIARQRTGE